MTAPQPAYFEVLNWIESEFTSGRLNVGNKLPGERALAEKFGISRASVREAIRVLAAMGLVRSSAGSGPSSGITIISEPSMALGWALRMHIATRSLPVADVVSVRVLMECEAARAASTARVSPQWRTSLLSRAGELLARMDEPTLSQQQFHQFDTQFHLAIAQLGGNVVLETILTSLREATIEYVQETVAKTGQWEHIRSTLQQQHYAILDAAKNQDGEACATLLREHILWFYSWVPQDSSEPHC